jgi:hypothetical protein
LRAELNFQYHHLPLQKRTFLVLPIYFCNFSDEFEIERVYILQGHMKDKRTEVVACAKFFKKVNSFCNFIELIIVRGSKTRYFHKRSIPLEKNFLPFPDKPIRNPVYIVEGTETSSYPYCILN